MGLRKDLDKIKKRYVYYILDENDVVIYVGTAVKPRTRFKTHIQRAKKGTSPFYTYIRENRIKIKLKIILEITSTYNEAEKKEIEHIIKHKETVFNFYNNPNKQKLKTVKKR